MERRRIYYVSELSLTNVFRFLTALRLFSSASLGRIHLRWLLLSFRASVHCVRNDNRIHKSPLSAGLRNMTPACKPSSGAARTESAIPAAAPERELFTQLAAPRHSFDGPSMSSGNTQESPGDRKQILTCAALVSLLLARQKHRSCKVYATADFFSEFFTVNFFTNTKLFLPLHW